MQILTSNSLQGKQTHYGGGQGRWIHILLFFLGQPCKGSFGSCSSSGATMDVHRTTVSYTLRGVANAFLTVQGMWVRNLLQRLEQKPCLLIISKRKWDETGQACTVRYNNTSAKPLALIDKAKIGCKKMTAAQKRSLTLQNHCVSEYVLVI